MARMLLDNGSSVDMIFKSILDQLLIESPKIIPNDTLFVSFTRDVSIPNGIITLHITIGKVPNQVIQYVDFLIIDS